MPHSFVKTKLSPTDLVQHWQEQTFHLEDIRIKVQRGYSHPNHTRAIFPCLVMESFNDRRFYLEVRQKADHKLIINLDSFTPVPRTVGVRLALAWFSQNIKNVDKNCLVEKGNIGDYFDLLNRLPSQQADELSRLQEKLSPQMKAFDLRSKANQFIISLERSKPTLNWKEIYFNDHPVEIEVGPGKGKFILNESQKNPDKNYLAIEWAGRYLKVLSEKIPRFKLGNVRLLNADARIVFKDWIPHSSITGIHIYYPDPWWKRKHQKHKLFTEKFVHNIKQALVSNGFFSFATDVEEVYSLVKELIESVKHFVNIHEKIYQNGEDTPPGRTNFEIKKWQVENTIYETKWQKEKIDELALPN